VWAEREHQLRPGQDSPSTSRDTQIASLHLETPPATDRNAAPHLEGRSDTANSRLKPARIDSMTTTRPPGQARREGEPCASTVRIPNQALKTPLLDTTAAS
jgi:hypothetical protein